MRRQDTSVRGRGWGPFSGRQLTIVIVAISAAIVLTPAAAIAVSGAFTSTTATPAIRGTNSSSAAGAVGVTGINTGVGTNTRFGVVGQADGTAGIGVRGTGTKYGVYSNGPLGIAAGKSLSCTGCIGPGALAASAKTHCSGYPHANVDWTLPGSIGGNGCELYYANLSNAMLSGAHLTNAAAIGVNLYGANLSGASVDDADLFNANMSTADLTGADLHDSNLGDAKLYGARLVNANLVNANLYGADLNKASLFGANLTGANVTSVIWGDTTCPNGQNSIHHFNSCLGQGGGL